MTTALIAGQGQLPRLIVDALRKAQEPFVVAALNMFEPDLPGVDVDVFRLERLVPFLDRLAERGVERICLAGAVRRPKLEPELFDPRTATLVPRILAAMQPGDDATLRTFLAIFEEHGFGIVGAHELAPDLLPDAGVLTSAGLLPQTEPDARLGEATVAEMGRADTGQSCVVVDDLVVAREGPAGTDAMLASLKRTAGRGILFKAPKPTQDRRVDLPVIGPGTARLAAEAGLGGIVIEAGGVMVLDLPAVVRALDAQGMFLWVRPSGGQA
ncbi:UDP-2,3-diacylglucosamine diphosphatase LpxI [Defluviimonas sp. WL0002]|uniref:UDP-2,3-diacylglucosamine diphosphatase LpxI n=1 Tax=Albidovulum marisflavi TaxID=2984159 RepID=A0ABT2ZG17_9RHOB|nr:UDP-2,3-diacylglucosamine diphosphatase LpxI [Defluviimonas sp. WL0002]MCV2870074.1 UDP-2,3-diacylglucosamine diphosphatase LpxI [Defluviimonas sp. WL0002]